MSATLLVHEDHTRYIPHDQLFKELIHTFFEEFLEAFFPEVHHHIDFTSIKPLSGEVFTDLIDGESRKADIVIEAKLKGEDTLIIIHVEPQSYSQPNFHERMYHYFSLLYNKYRKPILPIAIFSYDEKRNEQNEFTIAFPFFHVLTFNFLLLELRKMNWRNYLESNNPVAAALLSKMGYKENERIKVKIELLRMLTKMELNPAKTRLIHSFFEKYLTLNEREEEELMDEIKQLKEGEQILELPISYEERGIEKGIKKGIERGIKKVAGELLKEGSSIEFVAKVTHLDREEIESIRENL
ncbi:Rpn family recombination-promoting nuclease/putative transposase [Virgibacillus sp. C22-A2]|uniref:Rpn family recombination-promoting nuclease/putative transposase n=1 Tax=Virgibacillus tibetensis TaxID=3042313 RepID=A0ABU6KDQ7_9BACI|nr:Rpn family recombination-promoting nuclease/putative transposase [Virgibacillus sp. C22-A2]